MSWITKHRNPLGATAFIACVASVASAETPLTAGVIMEEMSADERFAYVAGVVEGLAHLSAEIRQACIFDCFYGDDAAAVSKVYRAFELYPDRTAAPIILALTKPSCGAP